MPVDVPSPIDLRLMADARPWAETAMAKRPARPEFFDAFARLIRRDGARVLELGSGPGFLADHLLRALPGLDDVALDFSPARHQLAAERLGDRTARVRFVERSFREPTWSEGLGRRAARRLGTRWLRRRRDPAGQGRPRAALRAMKGAAPA